MKTKLGYEEFVRLAVGTRQYDDLKTSIATEAVEKGIANQSAEEVKRSLEKRRR